MTDAKNKLIELASQGDPVAMDELLEAHLPALEAYVRLRAVRELREKESCSDITQSVCREVLQNMNDFEYRGEQAFRAWLFMKAKSKIQDRLRYYHAQKRDIKLERRDATHVSGSSSNAVPSRCGEQYRGVITPSQIVMGMEEVVRFERAFDSLPEDYQEVITLARVVELPLEEVAQQMDKSLGSVRGLLQRGLRRLSWKLSESSEEDPAVDGPA